MVTKIYQLASLALPLFSFVRDINAVKLPYNDKRQLPANATGVTTITAPSGAQIRFKEPGKDGVCETTPGVNSYAGYIDLNATTHMFFWFFEARHDPSTAPLTLWLNGGPGSDSLIGLFQELGPCNVTENLTTELNPYSWTEVSNLLFLSQPVGVGFSYAEQVAGSLNSDTGLPQNASFGPVDGQYSVVDPLSIDTTDLAAIGTWNVLQGFLSALPQLDGRVASRTFHLWTESYGGHYGPAFFRYFYDQNLAIANGTANGTELVMDTLGIINGIIDEQIQAPYYPEFAVNNTYGIKAVNDTIYNFMKLAYNIANGCSDYVEYCAQSLRNSLAGYETCSQATTICRTFVEEPYYAYSGRGVYDIRHPYDDPTPPKYFRDFLNMASTQQALGVNLNYTSASSTAIYYGFAFTGDFVYPTFKTDTEMLLNNGVRVALIYGDADYICNWFGGEAVSLAMNYTHTAEFNAAGYTPFVVDNTEYGEVRQYGNFSFLRIYEAGHEVPFYQPLASLEYFRRTLAHQILADGSAPLTGDYSSPGLAEATHTEPFVPLPLTTSSIASASATAGIKPIPKPRNADEAAKARALRSGKKMGKAGAVR